MRAGLTEKGRLISEPNSELWENISSHTARRSFATIKYLDGYSPYEIMKITGHRSVKSLLNYIKVSQLDAAKKMHAHNEKRKANKTANKLRVAN